MKNFYDSDFRLGVLGGGQLGRMMIPEALKLNIHVSILDPNPNCPCAQIASTFVEGSFLDYQTVYDFGQTVDVLTIEIENVNVEALKELHRQGKTVYPKPENLEIIKDKGLQKEFYKANGIATSDFRLIESKDEITSFPIVQKLRTGGYDGKGVQILKSEDSLAEAFTEPSVLEDLVPIDKELSVIIARNVSGQTRSFPIVELSYNPVANLVEYLFAPADVTDEIEKKAAGLAKSVVDAMDFVGILAVEMFLDKDGQLMVNEVAPRTHNSGHHTIESCITSQFEQHLRAILNLPLGATELVTPAVMLNLLGEENHTGAVVYKGMEKALETDGVHIHLYGKTDTKPFRKMGNVTVVNQSLKKATEIAVNLKNELKATT